MRKGRGVNTVNRSEQTWSEVIESENVGEHASQLDKPGLCGRASRCGEARRYSEPHRMPRFVPTIEESHASTHVCAKV